VQSCPPICPPPSEIVGTMVEEEEKNNKSTGSYMQSVCSINLLFFYSLNRLNTDKCVVIYRKSKNYKINFVQLQCRSSKQKISQILVYFLLEMLAYAFWCTIKIALIIMKILW